MIYKYGWWQVITWVEFNRVAAIQGPITVYTSVPLLSSFKMELMKEIIDLHM